MKSDLSRKIAAAGKTYAELIAGNDDLAINLLNWARSDITTAQDFDDMMHLMATIMRPCLDQNFEPLYTTESQEKVFKKAVRQGKKENAAAWIGTFIVLGISQVASVLMDEDRRRVETDTN